MDTPSQQEHNDKSKNSNPSVLWTTWLFVILISPALPLQVFDQPKEVVQHASWLAYGIVLIASLVVSALKSREKKSYTQNYAEILSLGLGLSLLGSAIAAAVGFAGCIYLTFSRL
jgi:hypothetical protein